MKKIILSFCFSVSVIFSSFAQNVVGKMEGNLSTDIIYLQYYPDLMGYREREIITDSAIIVDGKFSFTVPTGKVPRFAELIQKRKKKGKKGWDYLGSMHFFLSKDTALVVCRDSLKGAKIYNSPVNYDYQVLMEFISPLETELVDFEKKIATDRQGVPQSISSSKEYQSFNRKRFQLAGKKLSEAYETFIESFPDSWMSLHAFEKRSRADQYLTQGIFNLYAKLGKHLKESELGTDFAERMAKRMQLQPGAEAPGFSLPNIKGDTVKLSDYRGKYVLLEFWGTNCAACRAEAPNLKGTWERYQKRGFEIFSVSLDDSRYIKREGWLNAIKQDGTGLWQQVCDFKGWNSPVAIAYDIKSIPQNYLIGPDGKIISENLKGIDLDNKLEEVIGL